MYSVHDKNNARPDARHLMRRSGTPWLTRPMGGADSTPIPDTIVMHGVHDLQGVTLGHA